MDRQQQHYRGVPSAIKLDEINSQVAIPSKVQVLRCGSFSHPQYGDFKITPETLLTMKKNFDARTRGIDLAIDYSHESEKEAAAWVKGVELSDDASSLWFIVDWTPAGQKTLSDKEYRYLSADFTFNFINNETKKDHGPTLYGAGLTNRPVIKDMAPVVQLQESISPEPIKGDKNMDPKDQKIAELEAKIKELEGKSAPAPDDHAAKMAAMEKELGDAKAKLGEYQAKEVAAAEAAKCAEKKGKFDLMLSEAKVVEAQREAFMSDDMAKFVELAKPLKLSEQGSAADEAKRKETEGKTVQEQVLALADEKVKTLKVTAGEAIRLVFAEKPELKTAYYEGKQI